MIGLYTRYMGNRDLNVNSRNEPDVARPILPCASASDAKIHLKYNHTRQTNITFCEEWGNPLKI